MNLKFLNQNYAFKFLSRERSNKKLKIPLSSCDLLKVDFYSCLNVSLVFYLKSKLFQINLTQR
jgi:hypothetical protein